MPRKVFVYRNSVTGSHSLLEVVASDDVPPHRGTMDSRLVNGLTCWRSLSELISLLEETGPMVDRTIYEEEHRVRGIEEVIRALDGNDVDPSCEFGHCRTSDLLEQLCLERVSGGIGELSLPSAASTSRAVQASGLFESCGDRDLRLWASLDPDCKVVIEPVCDLVFIRNLGSVLLRVVANICEAKSGEDVLIRSGFIFDCPTKCLDRMPYLLPCMRSGAIDPSLNFSTAWSDTVFAYMVVNPLMSIFDRGTGGELMQTPRSLYCFEIPEHDSQLSDAKEFVLWVEECLKSLTSDIGEPLGWEIGPPSPFDDAPRPRFEYHTAAARLFGSIFYREDCLAVSCKNCGRGILVKKKGKRRMYCSASCRTSYSVNSYIF